jgi:hypothetical protein
MEKPEILKVVHDYYSRVIKKKLYLIFVQHCSFFEAFMYLNHRKFFFVFFSIALDLAYHV